MDRDLNWVKKSSSAMYLLLWLVELSLAYGLLMTALGFFWTAAGLPGKESALVVYLGFDGIGWANGSTAPALLALSGAILADGLVRIFLFGSALLVFRDLSDGASPFSEQNAVRIRRIALLTALTACTDGLPGLLDGRSGLVAIAAPVLMGAVLYGLAEIFAYGSQLQRQSDETL